MSEAAFSEIIAGLYAGGVAPYLGPGVLVDVVNRETGEPIPADSDSLILAMNNGKPMAPRLMYEFSRAAMNLELRRGRQFINRFLVKTYAETPWSRAAVHAQLARCKLPSVVDINRDTQLQDAYQGVPHLLIVGVARTGGTDYRFRIYHHDGGGYRKIEPATETVDTTLPILFKPLGSPRPEPSFIASDADFVDYMTELMGGFAIPRFLKAQRRGKRYLLLGLRLNRDTERLVLSEIIHDAAQPAGWTLIQEPTPKEQSYCEKKGIQILRADIAELMAALPSE